METSLKNTLSRLSKTIFDVAQCCNYKLYYTLDGSNHIEDVQNCEILVIIYNKIERKH